MTTVRSNRGPQPGTKHASHLTKSDIKAFALFCLRDDIAVQLERVLRPHQLAVKLYENETGIKIPTTTAYKQRGRWSKINGELCEIRKVKDFVPPARPKTPKRKKSFVAPTQEEEARSDQKQDSVTDQVHN